MTQAMMGAIPSGEGVLFRVWAPEAHSVEVVGEDNVHDSFLLVKNADGVFEGTRDAARPGFLYRYRIDGRGPFPDPVSRYQPRGVHGPSEVIDASSFHWTDADWKGRPLKDQVFYELHVGTFSPQGTFSGVIERLPYLAELGITTVELMPIAEFAGSRNWGYDGVSLYSPSSSYGEPDDLRRLVDRAHALGLGVVLDVVYNHLGPDGNYLGAFSPFYFTDRHQTPWGSAVNLDGPHADQVRSFFIQNAQYWIHEFHMDGLRFDATHAMVDESSRHFLAQLTSEVRSSVTDRHIALIAEDCRNLAYMLKPEPDGGWGLEGVWSDDFHHQVRRSLAGDHEGYYQDFSGTIEDLCSTIRDGWFFSGQPSVHFGGPRGTPSTGISLERFIFFIQNHDQIGNRAFGERLNQQTDAARFRAATVLLLCAPETPMLFMGQEWASSQPFLYFTDHEPKLGALVTEGRRSEFKGFSYFSDPASRERIPDPQQAGTFGRSRLNWLELQQPAHAAVLRLHKALLTWRRSEFQVLKSQTMRFTVTAVDETFFCLHYGGAQNLQIVICWKGSGTFKLIDADQWQTILTTESVSFAPDPLPIRIDADGIRFSRPGALILKRNPQ